MKLLSSLGLLVSLGTSVPIVVDVGPSDRNPVTTRVDVPGPDTGTLNCPSFVDRGVWLTSSVGSDDLDDTFEISVAGTSVQTTRTDADEGWGIDLIFECQYDRPDPDKFKTSARTTPGIEFIGNGYDVLSGNPIATDGLGDQGLRRTPFLWTYEDGLTTRDFLFAIPDRTTSNTFQTCSTETMTNTFSSSLEYQRIITNSFNINLPLPGGVQFTLNSEFMRTRNSTDDRQEVYAQVTSTCSVYQVSMGTFDLPPFNNNFLTAMILMPVEYNEDFMHQFLSEFGTHYINEMRLGGRFGAQLSYTRDTYQAFLDANFEIEVAIGAMVMMNQLNVSGSGSDDRRTDFGQLSEVSTNRSFSIGARYDEDPEIWMTRLQAAPLPVSYSLTRITRLMHSVFLPSIPDIDAKRENTDRAVDDWCNIQQRRIPNFSCVPPMQLPLPMPNVIAENAIRRVCIRNSGGFAIRWTIRYFNTQGEPRASGDSGTYSAGFTRCLDIADSPAERGNFVSARVRAIAGREVDLDELPSPHPNYDVRSQFEMHATCTGSTGRPRCRFTGFQRVLSGPQQGRRRMDRPFDFWSNVQTPPSTQTEFVPATVKMNDALGQLATMSFFKQIGRTIRLGHLGERLMHDVLPAANDLIDQLMHRDDSTHFGVVQMEHAVGEACTMENVRFAGAKYKSKVVSAVECWMNCREDRGIPEGKMCKGWTHNEDDSRCLLFVKNKKTKAVSGFAATTGKRNCHPLVGKVPTREG